MSDPIVASDVGASVRSFFVVFALIGLATLFAYLYRNELGIPWFAPKRRQSDQGRRTLGQKREFQRARKLFQESKVVEAAQVLESIGLRREAVKMLEDAKRPVEAAALLARMDRPNRAGVLLARHGRWELAAQYFKAANMPLEVARCARQYGDFRGAAQYFFEAERFLEAGDSWKDCGDFAAAAKSYALADEEEKAHICYQKMLESNSAILNESHLDEKELVTLAARIQLGSAPLAYIEALAMRNRLAPVMLELIKSKQLDVASRCLTAATHLDIETLANLTIGNDALAKVFMSCLEAAGRSLTEPTTTKPQSKAEFPSEIEATIATSEIIVNRTKTDRIQETSRNQMEHRLKKLIPKIGFFAELLESEVLQILGHSHFETYHEGEVIVRFGEQPPGFMIIEQGIVKVSQASNTELRNEISLGECVGIAWVLLDELSPATYLAKTPVDVLVITKSNLDEIVTSNGDIARRLYKGLARQIRFDSVRLNQRKGFLRAS